MSDIRQINETYATIGAELIDTEDALIDIRNSQATIVYLSSDAEKKEKGKVILGQCERIQDKYKWGIPADFTITLFEPNIEGKSLEIIRRIIFHELLHVGIDTDDKTEEKYFVRPHDFEDFRECVQRWGVDWAENNCGFEADIDEWKEVKANG